MTNRSALADLFTPFDLGPVRLPNRFVMAPMTREFSPDGVVTDDVVGYYARRAAAGVGLIITEGVYVSEDSGPSTRVPRLFGEAQLAAWRRVVEAVHAEGGRIMPQLWHLGAARGDHAEFNPQLPSLSPSGLAPNGRLRGRAASVAELARIRDDFARAAAAAREAGFDGVELHGAHGYLLDQFLWAGTNRRTDAYGGTLEDRLRYPAEVVAAVRAAVGPDFPIVYRFSQWKSGDYGARIAETPEELAVVVRTLAEAGVTAFHPSTRRHWEPAFAELPAEDGTLDGRTLDGGTDDGGSAHLGLAGWTKRLSGLPVITVGSVGLDNEFEVTWQEGGRSGVRGLETLVEQFGRGEFDLVAVGRLLLSDPAWVAKVRDGRTDEIRPFHAEDRLRLS